MSNLRPRLSSSSCALLPSLALAILTSSFAFVSTAHAEEDTAVAAPPAGLTFALEAKAADASAMSVVQDAAGLWLAKEDAAPEALTLPVGFEAKAFDVGDARTMGDRWWIAGIDTADDRPRLAVLEGEGDTATVVSRPAPNTAGRELGAPKLVVQNDRPRYLLWLEGERFDAMAVHGAKYENGRFGPTELISPVGPGTQIALATAVLRDGTIMVTWAGYDGIDDEIWWSRTTENGWSAPARVADDDDVPDVTPTLIATRDGALLAWSAYDGREYRLKAARFENGAWQTPVGFGGRGATFPTFIEGASTPTLLYKTAVPRTWTVQVLGDAGVPGKQATVPRGSNRRPDVAIQGDQVSLVWPGQQVRPSAKVAFVD